MTCFFTSYVVVLVLELLRLLGRIPGRGLAAVVMMGIGLFTHVTYLLIRVISAGRQVTGGVDEIGLLASWTDWLLMVSLGMAVSYLVLLIRRPDTVVGLFFLPAVLATIGLGLAVRGFPTFSRTEAVEVWRSVHALAMVVGAGAVLVGFLAGVMYLTQASRLKRKRAGSALRLPTLETLGRLTRRCLVTSTIAVGLGVLAGVVMNLNRWGYVGWTEGGVLFSGLLFVWLLVSTGVELWFPSVRQSKKVIFLTLASFGFLVLAMLGLLSSAHGLAAEATSGPSICWADAGFTGADAWVTVAEVVGR